MKAIFLATLVLIALTSPALSAVDAVDYEIDSVTYQGYFISKTQNAPLILMIHDWDGLTDYEVKRSHMIADLGYAVFAADMFGKGVRPTATEDKKALTGALYQDRAKMRKLLKGALDAAEKLGANVDNAATIGYCFGGAVTLEHARSGANMKGFVSFHGGLSTPAGQDYLQTRGNLLILHGTADTAVTVSDFADLATELESTNIKHEMITYSGAPHAFTVFGSERYRKNADEKSWRRFTQFLDEIF